MALALVRNPAQAKRPTFRTDWAVFLPVRDQLDDEPITLASDVGDSFSLFLHAYAFLDAQRTRIDGLDANFHGDAAGCTNCN